MAFRSVLLAISMLCCANEGTAGSLAPAGKWTVEEVPSGCQATRSFGANGDTKLSIRRNPLDRSYSLTVSPPRPVALRDGKNAKIEVAPSGRDIESALIVYRTGGIGRASAFGMKIDAAALPLESATSLRIFSNDVALTDLTLDQMGPLMAAITKCKQGWMTLFGIDPTEVAKVGTPPQAMSSRTEWFRQDDYPAEARKARQQGLVVGRFRVKSDGSIDDCAVIVGSGSSALDKTTCVLVLLRAKYRPALSADGTPMASWQVFSTKWSLQDVP